MAKTIWKYKIVVNEFALNLPEDAEVLTVQIQEMVGPCMWILLDPDAPLSDRQFIVVATGQLLPDRLTGLGYIGTYQTMDGQLIWHLFEKLTRTLQNEEPRE